MAVEGQAFTITLRKRVGTGHLLEVSGTLTLHVKPGSDEQALLPEMLNDLETHASSGPTRLWIFGMAS